MSKHKYYGNTVKARPEQLSVVNVNQAKLFHAMIGNLHNPKLAINVDAGQYVNPADLYGYETVLIAQYHCEFGMQLSGEQVSQVASLGYKARDVLQTLLRLRKKFDGVEYTCTQIHGNAIVAPVSTFVEALWEACGIVVKRK